MKKRASVKIFTISLYEPFAFLKVDSINPIESRKYPEHPYK